MKKSYNRIEAVTVTLVILVLKRKKKERLCGCVFPSLTQELLLTFRSQRGEC